MLRKCCLSVFLRTSQLAKPLRLCTIAYCVAVNDLGVTLRLRWKTQNKTLTALLAFLVQAWKNCGGCNSGYTDMGCTCHRPLSSYAKSTYGRGVGSAAIDTYSKASKWLTPYPLSINTP
jgi:hypothetical protein